MGFVGSNDTLGGEKIRISGDRVAKPVQDKTEPFPCGVRGMVPLSTTKKGGGTQTVFVFKGEADLPKLQEAVDEANRLMAQAEGLCDCSFGAFTDVRVGVKSPGMQFCYVEYTPKDLRGYDIENPVRLCIQAPEDLGAPSTRTALVEYDREGDYARIECSTYREEGYSYRLVAMPAEKGGALRIHKVETVNRKGSARLVYKLR